MEFLAGGVEVLTLTPGTSPSATVSVEIAGSTTPLQGEYRPVLPFSDGASAFYTGHLYLLRDAATESTDEAPYLQAIELRPTAAARVAARRGPRGGPPLAPDGHGRLGGGRRRRALLGGRRRAGAHLHGLGGGWTDVEATTASLDLAQFVGHEASHFWNGWLIENQNPDEGSR